MWNTPGDRQEYSSSSERGDGRRMGEGPDTSEDTDTCMSFGICIGSEYYMLTMVRAQEKNCSALGSLGANTLDLPERILKNYQSV